MKTKQLSLLTSLLFIVLITKSNAQATVASTTNTVTATDFLGSGSTSNFDVLFKRNAVFAGLLATTNTSFGVNSLAMPNSVSIGVGAGQFSSGTGFNAYIGQNAGRGHSVSIPNTGTYNTFIGHSSGHGNSGSNNIIIGHAAGNANEGNKNIFIGNFSGADDGTSGNGNIFIGYGAGFYEYSGNKLIIDAGGQLGDQNIPLIWGDFQTDQLKFHGKVAIGGNSTINFGSLPTTAATVNVANYNLFVKGGILTEEVRVSLASTWADYVFAKDYKLKPLSEVERFINANDHLPNVPSAKQVKEEGVELGEMAKIQQEKIEELTLYLIEQNKINQAQNNEIAELKNMLKAILEKK